MKIHIAQKGDTLWNIAKKYNISFEQLEKENTQLSSPGAIYPGMKIKVPVEKVPAANSQDRQAAFENAEEEQLEATTESLEAHNGNNEEVEEEFLVRSDESPGSQIVEGVAPVHETQLHIEETLPLPLPPYPTIPKPPFSLPVAPPPPIVNTSLSSSYGNQILQKQTELITKQSQQKVEQTKEGVTAPTYMTEQQKEGIYTPSATTYPKPQLEYMGDVTQDVMGYQEQPIGYMKPAQYGKEGYFQGSLQAVQDGYQVQQPYAYGGGIVPGSQPKAPCGCGGAVPQTAYFGTEYGQGVPYIQGYPYGHQMQGYPYGYQESSYGYQMQGYPYGYQESPYGYPIHGVPYGYQEPPYGYPSYGMPYGYGAAPHVQPYKYYAPPAPTGYQQHVQAPYSQAQDATTVQSQPVPTQPVPTPIPAYPFPTASFKGQGYPDYYRDEDNTNFGVPPIDEED